MPRSPQQIAEYRAKLDKFAELLSLDLDMLTIRERMGLTNGRAQAMMCQIRSELGWQAR